MASCDSHGALTLGDPFSLINVGSVFTAYVVFFSLRSFSNGKLRGAEEPGSIPYASCKSAITAPCIAMELTHSFLAGCTFRQLKDKHMMLTTMLHRFLKY